MILVVPLTFLTSFVSDPDWRITIYTSIGRGNYSISVTQRRSSAGRPGLFSFRRILRASMGISAIMLVQETA